MVVCQWEWSTERNLCRREKDGNVRRLAEGSLGKDPFSIGFIFFCVVWGEILTVGRRGAIRDLRREEKFWNRCLGEYKFGFPSEICRIIFRISNLFDYWVFWHLLNNSY